MTEIPEHLLKRAAERRAALGGEGDAEPAAAAATPATGTDVEPAAPAAPAAAPVAAVEAPPAPVAPYVDAAGERKKIPYWAAPVLLSLPLWIWAYVFTLKTPPVTNEILTVGTEVYQGEAGSAACAGCHGAGGGGGIGRQLSSGEVSLTFPGVDGIAPQVYWVALGTNNWGVGQPIGDPNRAGGAHSSGAFGQMPAFPDLTLDQLIGVTLHERTAWNSGPEVDNEIAFADAFVALHASGELEAASEINGEEVKGTDLIDGTVTEDDIRAYLQPVIDQLAAQAG